MAAKMPVATSTSETDPRLYWSRISYPPMEHTKVKLGRRISWLLFVMLISLPVYGTSWYVRPDGGTRYSGKVTSGQCDGKADSPYGGKGVNQHCAYNDFRYLWDDNSGAVGQGAWVIAGGDTVVVRGCKALPGQQNPSNPTCRVGWDKNIGSGPDSSWCYGVGSYSCLNPPIPAGTASQHTRILGQNYAACNTGGATNPKLYASNLTQIFGGFSLGYTLNLEKAKYVDIQCLEITSHNGACTTFGIPRYPRACNTNQPLDDYGNSGILTNNATSNVTLQDVYIHGFNSAGLFGPIGGPINMTRVFIGFNASSGWNFDDGRDTPNAAGSSINANYVIMEGNGCYEQYPIVNAFPAQVCYDTNSQGFGDSWSGQNATLDSFICNHCQMLYNTKDGFIGPHTAVTTLVIENSESIGNMGQQWKWGAKAVPTNTTFINNLTIGNCSRMSASLPGAPPTYNKYLSGFCRAAGDVFAFVTASNSHVLIANNTVVAYSTTVFDLACQPANTCGSTSFNFTNNIFLGYYLKGAEAPGLVYTEDHSIKLAFSHNVEYGNKSGSGGSCRGDNICSDPRLVNEPPQQGWPNQTFLDNFNFHPTSGSTVNGHGVAVNGITTDYYGSARPNPPSIGAVEPNR
jgi:hypothetical protein